MGRMKQIYIELLEAGCIDEEGNFIPGTEEERNRILDAAVAEFERLERRMACHDPLPVLNDRG